MLTVMKKPIAMLLLSAAIIGNARTLDVTPGSLAEQLTPGQGTPDTSLTLRGSIDARDLETLREQSYLTDIDLSQVEIAEYSSATPLWTGNNYSPAATLPPYSLFGLTAESLTLPLNLKKIADGALAGSSLRTLVIPEGVTSLGDNALYGSRQLESLTLPSSLATIGRYALASCPMLSSVNLEATVVRYLPDRCLAGTESLKKVNLTHITGLGSEVFSGSGVLHIYLPEAREFAPYALAGMPNVGTVSLRDDAIIDRGLLMDNVALHEVRGVPGIIPALFAANCSTYSPSSAVSSSAGVGEFAFANTAATSLVIGRDIAWIAPYAFAGCTGLSMIDVKTLGAYIPEVTSTSFDGISVPDVLLVVEKGCEDSWRSHPVWGKFNIVNSTSGVDDITIDHTDSHLTLTVNHGFVMAESDSPGLTLSVYDLSGHIVSRTGSAETSLTLPLAELPEGILLLDLKGADGSSRRLKLLN